jgi:hypothetical protein
MTTSLPTSGGTYEELLQPGINPLAVRKGIITDILIRDYRNLDDTVHNLSDPTVGLGTDGYFTPYAQDGTLRNDLLVTGSAPNLGFYHLGALHEDGTKIGHDTKVQPTMIAQSKRAVRFDVTSDDDIITIKALDATPLIDALRYDLPLSDLPDLGQANYTVARPAESMLIERQVIALGFDGDNFFAQTFPRMALQDRGDDNWNKHDPDTLEIHLGSLLCPFVGKPVLYHREGGSWRALQGVPVFSTAPVAAAVTGASATVTFDLPTSKSSSYTYTVEQSTDAGTTWTNATVGTTTGTSSIVITVTGLTISTPYVFRVTAVGSSKLSTVSAKSNSVTAIA